MTETITTSPPRVSTALVPVAPSMSKELATALSQGLSLPIKPSDIEDRLANPAARTTYVALINGYPDQERMAVTYALQDVRSSRETFAALKGRAADVCSRTSTTVAASTLVGSVLLQFGATPPNTIVLGISVAASLVIYGVGEFLSQRWYESKLRADNGVTIIKEMLGQIRPPAIASTPSATSKPEGAAQ